jgi:hypothetical protein
MRLIPAPTEEIGLTLVTCEPGHKKHRPFITREVRALRALFEGFVRQHGRGLTPQEALDMVTGKKRLGGGGKPLAIRKDRKSRGARRSCRGTASTSARKARREMTTTFRIETALRHLRGNAKHLREQSTKLLGKPVPGEVVRGSTINYSHCMYSHGVVCNTLRMLRERPQGVKRKTRRDGLLNEVLAHIRKSTGWLSALVCRRRRGIWYVRILLCLW